MFGFGKKSEGSSVEPPPSDNADIEPRPQRPWLETALPVFACGAGLFSDGYINNVIGSVNTTLKVQYKDVYINSNAFKYVADIAFAGTVVGQLIFGFLADHWSRTNTLMVSTVILIIFTALAAGSYWHGEPVGMFNMLTAWRFFVGIGIGGEYPAGSVGCAESSSQMKKGTRNRWFILFTNSMIDFGFVIGAFVPYVVAAACHNGNFSTIWRTSLGIGVAFPLVLFVMRLGLKEPEEFTQYSMRHQTPYWLVLRYYWFRLLCVSLVWFLYNFSSYAFGIYSSSILSGIYGPDAPLTTVFGWNTVVNMFYLPGTLIGAFVSDWIGPRYTLALGVTLQAIVGFIMAGVYSKISNHIAAFAVVFGIFQALGELGPGNNIGLLAAKTSATGVRGRYYGIAAATGKIGAFVGTWVFPYIQKAGGNDTESAQYPFWVSSSLCLLSAAIVLICIPHVGQDTIAIEDQKFREYLQSHGWDTAQLGVKQPGVEEGAVVNGKSDEK
ncbi:glycerophosphoinositol permease [Fusarium piperis]|uniref:Glycerophosphoinositol permease n=1 Tax=Fusarium piperis TaxID=1435070 RepID=A0A9W8WNK5_9HYPO|nr:glycerophosphoinositol permease [Fusarium piperis]